MRRYGIFLVVILLGVTGGLRDAFDDWVDRTDLPQMVTETSVEVTARDGRLLRAFTVADGRWRLDPGPVDPLFLQMLIAYEDKRFYNHSGVDLRAMSRAAAQAAWNGRVISGGSTLTMQVARLLEASGTGRLSGKLRQIRVALALERRLTKDQVLEIYLRIAPYGGNLEGVRAASLAYFGKEPRRLTPAEAALLVALPQSPETRRPDRAPRLAEAARARVLARMDGTVLDAERARVALTEPVPVKRRTFPALAPHLADRLRVSDPLISHHQTTIDATLQKSLETLAARAVARQGARLSVAILVADHQTGEILASVGAADWADDTRAGFVDMTEAKRSPGSTLKPFVYGLAFDDGLAHPETLIEDRPTAFGTYAPQNFDKTFRGTVSIRQALQLSLNIPVVTLTQAIGPARLMAALRRAGIEPKLPGGKAGLAIALGGVGVSLRDLVQAYAGLARLGDPVVLSERLDQSKPLPQRFLSPVSAWSVGNILSGLAPPPGAPANRLAYKTGTSYGHRDAWAIGFDGRHVVGVWLGRADGSSVPGAFGSALAAPVLFQTFGRIKPQLDPLPPPPSATLILPNARLPKPLQRFRPRDALFSQTEPGAPEVAFPPDGAEVETDGVLVVKVRDGIAPFTWLANGAPVAVASRAREETLALHGLGDVTLSVIDARGRSSAVSIQLR